MNNAEPPAQVPVSFQMELPPDMIPGVFSDFANIWHTNNTFVLDFLATAQPLIPQSDEEGRVVSAVIPTRVVARVRIPSEQIYPVINALRT